MSLGRSNSVGVLQSVKRRPRPLQLGAGAHRMSAVELSSVEDVIVLMENTVGQLDERNYEYTVLSALSRLCENLKQCGPQLENLYQDQLDKLAVAIRNACRDDELDLLSRVHLLEIIELRAMNWIPNEITSTYFRQKYLQLDQELGTPSPMVELRTIQTAPISLNVNAPDFNPTLPVANLLNQGEIMASSGRFLLPTKIPGKNYFKDEIVIRNSDSGKVMGLKGRRVHMIEEMTETVISFQRVIPGAKERLVQITGPAPDNILQAKRLIEDTIRRNQSPGRDEEQESPQDTLTPNDSRRNTLLGEQRDRGDSVSIAEYKYTVNVGDSHIKITGVCLDLVRTAKLVLDEYFSIASSPFTADTQFEDILLPSPVRSDSKLCKPSHVIQEANCSTLARPKKAVVPSPYIQAVVPSVVPSPLEKPLGTSRTIVTTTLPEIRIVYSRTELLKISRSPECRVRPGDLDLRADPSILGTRNPVFDGAEHLRRGLGVFRVDYAKPYPAELEE